MERGWEWDGGGGGVLPRGPVGGEEFGDPPVEVNGEQPPGARAEFAPLPQVVNPRSFYGCGRVVDLR